MPQSVSIGELIIGCWISTLPVMVAGCSSEPDGDDCDESAGPVLVEKITDEVLPASCVPRVIWLDDRQTPGDTSDDVAPCTLLEATHEPAGCRCGNAAGRTPVLGACIADGRQMDDAVKTALAKDGRCSNDSAALPSCSEFCVCVVEQYSEPVQKASCLNDIDFVADDGWCYVDPLPPPSGQGVGNEVVVADCPDGQKRKLRYEPASGAATYIRCSGNALPPRSD